MTAAEAVKLGPIGFDRWIDAQVYGNHAQRRSRGRVSSHRASMRHGWLLTQPVIGWARKHPAQVIAISTAAAGAMLALAMAWKLATR